MPRIVRDWTKVIIPRTNSNSKYNNEDSDTNTSNESFNTTDMVSIASISEIIHLINSERRKSLTDFSLMNSAYQSKYIPSITGNYTGQYWLRTSNHLFSTATIECSGEVYDLVPINRSYLGLSPVLSIKIPESGDITEYGEIEKVVSEQYNIDYYTIKIGEYPKTKASPELNNELESLFNGGHLKSGLKCTGKLYTTNGETSEGHPFLSKQNAEFEYNGEKYVRVTSLTASPDFIFHDKSKVGQTDEIYWVKVEPITFIILNSHELEKGTATEIELDSEEIILSGIPFLSHNYQSYVSMWQNSLIRAFLNSANSDDLDGNSKCKIDVKFDFRNSGFLHQAFNMTREPTSEYIIPKTEASICNYAFRSCVGLEKIIIPEHVTSIGKCVFGGCVNTQIIIPASNPKLAVDKNAFDETDFKFVYISKNDDSFILSPYEDASLDNDYIKFNYNQNSATKLFNKNFRINFTKLNSWKQTDDIEFIPPDYVLQTFPPVHMSNFFLNNNQKKWAELIKTLKFDSLNDVEKEKYLTVLLKIYYVLGGFSKNQNTRNKAFDYVVNHVAINNNDNLQNDTTPEVVGNKLYNSFASLDINNLYNPMFATFFMKYYHQNPDFMRFHFTNTFDEVIADADGSFDYLCIAFNNFKSLQERYPYHGVTGNTNNLLFTPKFVAENILIRNYKNVRPGNEQLATLIGRYGYSQEDFEYIQDIFDDAKLIKDYQVIHARKSSGANGITFRVLEKDDPEGFIIGHETTCCQHIGDDGEECVIDGYLNPNAGFIVFEQPILDKNGNPTEESRVLAQAYMWYDPETKTVCFDNIEIPVRLLETMRSGTKHNQQFSSNALLDAVIESADAIMAEMNRRGIPVERVTTGKGHNKLRHDLQERFGEPESPPIAKHRGYDGYSDALKSQYLIRTYDETTKYYSENIKQLSKSIKDDLEWIVEQNNIQNQNRMGK